MIRPRLVYESLRVRPSLSFGLIVAIITALALVLATRTKPSTALLIAWDAGAIAYLALLFTRMTGVGPDEIRRRAARLDEGQWAILVLTIGAALVSVVAILIELAGSKGGGGAGWRTALAAVTVLASWTLVHTVFAQHYAHSWFQQEGCLDFPGENGEPDYSDFLYFSFVIGMTFQVSDVQTKTRGMRRIVLAHGLVSFLFNTVILALSVNLAAGLA